MTSPEQPVNIGNCYDCPIRKANLASQDVIINHRGLSTEQISFALMNSQMAMEVWDSVSDGCSGVIEDDDGAQYCRNEEAYSRSCDFLSNLSVPVTEDLSNERSKKLKGAIALPIVAGVVALKAIKKFRNGK